MNKFIAAGPECIGCSNDVKRMREVQKKIVNDLNYVWLVRSVDNIFLLSSSLFGKSE